MKPQLQERFQDTFPAWKCPDVELSEPPEEMGKQMGVVQTIGSAPLGHILDGDIKVFTLIAQPVEQVLTDGEAKYWNIIPEKYRYPCEQRQRLKQKVKVWGFNGQCPGPTIEVTEGDRVRIIVKNELPEPTSIHWHGLEVPNRQDGAGGVTQFPVLPGHTGIYEFTIYQSGTFLYHSGFNVTKQDISGLSGIFVAHPKDPEQKIDADFAILLQQFSIKPGNEAPNLASMAAQWNTFNGRVAPTIPVMTVHEGDRVRIRLGNLSLTSHPIHIHGYTWEVVGTEGGPIPKSARWPGATVNIAPGETRDVEFVAWNPGIWRFHCHKLHHIINDYGDVPWGIQPHGGMYTYLYVIPKDSGAPWQHPTQAEVAPE
jgi:manganese oxidase